jgi:hypothetical protein
MADVNPRPVIRDLQPGDWIDLDELGDDHLVTYIKYPGIAVDDILWPNWRGCGAQGEIEDHSGSRVDVNVEDGYTPELGMPVEVPNNLITMLNQGWGFYSYAVSREPTPGDKGPESLRQFCYIGERPATSSRLPVPQIKESHDLALDPEDVLNDATAIVPPYRAMSVGDKVIFTWQGYQGENAEPPHQETQILKAEDLGQPLMFKIPYIEIYFIEGERADISYRVEYVEGAGRCSDSDVQTLQIVPPASPSLLPIAVKGDPTGPIDPGDYRNGLVVQVKPVYPGIKAGDWVLVYWTGSENSRNVIKALQVDRSTLDSGVIEWLIEPHWLAASSNAQVTVMYQFARGAAAQSAAPLILDISKELNLPPPIVEGAAADGTDKGVWAANTSGVYIDIPSTAEIGSNRVEMHWQGHPNGGQHIALTPVPGNNRRFQIPASAIAANMSARTDAHFPVFYRVFTAGHATGKDSRVFNLRITPLPASRYPFTTSPQIINNTMSLAAVSFSGADLEIYTAPPLDAWPFMAKGQLLKMQASGARSTGGTISYPVRDALPVTDPELRAKKISMKLPKSQFLELLKIDEPFTLKASVSFDGGETYTEFMDSTPKLVR